MPNPETTLSTILAAAERLFTEKNFADVSMRDIAEAAQVSTGALYHHFPGKEKLYYAMLTAYLARLRQETRDATPREGSCRARLRELTRVFMAQTPARRGLMRLVRRDVNVFRGRTREGLVHAYQAAVPDLVGEVLARGIERGELRRQDARWLAWAYVGIIETTLSEYAEEKLGSMNARLEAALDLFFDGATKTNKV